MGSVLGGALHAISGLDRAQAQSHRIMIKNLRSAPRSSSNLQPLQYFHITNPPPQCQDNVAELNFRVQTGRCRDSFESPHGTHNANKVTLGKSIYMKQGANGVRGWGCVGGGGGGYSLMTYSFPRGITTAVMLCDAIRGREFHAGRRGSGRKEGRMNSVSPWSAGGRVSLLCFSESERFLCPGRSASQAAKREREKDREKEQDR